MIKSKKMEHTVFSKHKRLIEIIFTKKDFTWEKCHTVLS